MHHTLATMMQKDHATDVRGVARKCLCGREGCHYMRSHKAACNHEKEAATTTRWRWQRCSGSKVGMRVRKRTAAQRSTHQNAAKWRAERSMRRHEDRLGQTSEADGIAAAAHAPLADEVSGAIVAAGCLAEVNIAFVAKLPRALARARAPRVR